MPLDRNADPDAMAARIKELEAAQAAAPPVSPLVRLWAIAGEVLGMFPKWLLVAALAVFLAYHGYSYFMQSSRMQSENDLVAAQKAQADAQAAQAAAQAHAMGRESVVVDLSASPTEAPSQSGNQLSRLLNSPELHGAADGGSCDPSLPPLPKGTTTASLMDRRGGKPPCVAR